MNEGTENDSPKLKPVKPNLGPDSPSPPPFAREEPPRDKHADKDAHKSRQLTIGIGAQEADDALLRNTFGANYPRLWSHEADRPPSDPPPPRWGHEREKRRPKPSPPLWENGKENQTYEPSVPSQRPPELVGPKTRFSPKPLHQPRVPPALQDQAQGALSLLRSDPNTPRVLPPISDFDRPKDSEPPPTKQLRLEGPPSPLREFMIGPPGKENPLAPLCSPSKAPSPEDSTRLPPIAELKSALPPQNGFSARTAGPQYPLPPVATSPPTARVAPSPRESHQLAPLVRPPYQPSPYPYLSPASTQTISAVPSPISQQTYRHPQSAYPYDPPSTNSHRSPGSSYLPTPIDHPSTGPFEPAFTPSSQSSASAVTGAFKCTHPGCTAAPFQTQYLLNSHANVHSQDRPHFCPVEGCSRGPGGKGFKRKNEMIRHGLVHNSPGYVCPFCPDQQHKYPRPDNLQRHVRVHHVDKNKDDQALRNVLAQRPEGSGRGRRRRNPQ